MDGFKGWVNGWKERKKKEEGGLVGFGWEWKSEGVVEGWGGVGWGGGGDTFN